MKIHETPKHEKLRVLVIWGVKHRLKGLYLPRICLPSLYQPPEVRN